MPAVTVTTLSELYRLAICIPRTGCIVWDGKMVRGGYGRVSIRRGHATDLGLPQSVLVHRLAWRLAARAIPQGMQIDHLCRNRACINVDHLEVVTPSENVRRSLGPALSAIRMREMRLARAKAVTHCPRGHEYTPENTYTHNGCRTCRECQRERVRAYRASRSPHGPLHRP
jgi:hypothetical protein